MEEKETAARKEEMYRKKQAVDFNRRHRVITQPQLSEGERVYIKDKNMEGTVTEKHHNPRSYRVKADSGTIIRRNRSALVTQEASAPTEPPQETTTAAETSQNVTRTRSGRVVRPPDRLDV